MADRGNPPRPRTPWKAWQVRELCRLYPHTTARKITFRVKKSVSSIYQKARALGLYRDPTQVQDINRMLGRHMAAQEKAIRNRFPKGHVPANKGRKGISYPGTVATQFKKGHKPQTWVPVGTEVIRDGYLTRKVSDKGNPSRRDWKAVHIIVWEKRRGLVPPNHVVIFRDGNKENIRLSNLKLLSRRENMLRNTLHRYPKEVVQVIQLRGAINRQITLRGRIREKQDRGSA